MGAKLMVDKLFAETLVPPRAPTPRLLRPDRFQRLPRPAHSPAVVAERDPSAVVAVAEPISAAEAVVMVAVADTVKLLFTYRPD